MKIKLAGFGLMGILAMLVIPADPNNSPTDVIFYGAATMVQKDSSGQETFSQTIHNRIVNEGENFLLISTFDDGTTTVADDVQMGTICISTEVSATTAETDTAVSFDAANPLTTHNCQRDPTVNIASNTTGTAVIGALTFQCGNKHCVNDDTITKIGICRNTAASNGTYADCAPRGELFATVDVTDTTLGAGETVDITYTFDISSAGT